MFYLARTWGDPAWCAPDRAASSLGLFAGHPADHCRHGADFFAELAGPRAPNRKGWTVARSPGGKPVLLLGVIDNVDELAADLGVTGGPERVYGAAVERWGDQADRQVIGEYASLVALDEGTVRLARSPWSGYPLYYHLGRDGVMAASIQRPLFAAGLAMTLRPGMVERLAALESIDDAHSQFEGIEQVGGGTVVLLGRTGQHKVSFYDPLAIPAVRFKRDGEYVEAAGAMLGEAVGKCLRGARRPGVTLSGGLDSALVCDEMLRQAPAGQSLKAFTFVPLDEWDGTTAPHMFGSDRPHVEAFLRGHPGLDHQFVDNRGLDFLSLQDERLLASGAPAIGSGVGYVHLGVLQAAREAGCDTLLTAWMGNMTLSGESPWAAATWFRQLRWRQVWRLAQTRLVDSRPLWRRFIATGLMPNLPPPLRGRIRGLLPSGSRIQVVANPYLAPDGPLAAKRADAALVRSLNDLDYLHSRERFLSSLFVANSHGGESALGMQQLTGLGGRDVLAYRPLVELCFGMPDEQFVHDGERRRLARRMAVGRLPEAQRTERRHGDHATDWHLRMTRLLPRLREEVERIAAHPELGSLLDARAMRHDLDAWPARAPSDMVTINRLRFSLPAMISARKYIDFVSGRNAA